MHGCKAGDGAVEQTLKMAALAAEAAERVLAVDVLRAMKEEGLHAEHVAELLSASKVWREFADQRHDLFLPLGASPHVYLPL